jgi:hypothetical protein
VHDRDDPGMNSQTISRVFSKEHNIEALIKLFITEQIRNCS